MKPCVNCMFCDRRSVMVAPGQVQMMFVCTHPELLDPVEGSPLPCHTTRSNADFCGIRGIRWKEKASNPKEPTEIEVLSDRKVIQLR